MKGRLHGSVLLPNIIVYLEFVNPADCLLLMNSKLGHTYCTSMQRTVHRREKAMCPIVSDSPFHLLMLDGEDVASFRIDFMQNCPGCSPSILAK